MLKTDEYEGYSYSVFGKPGKLFIGIQDWHGKDILEEDECGEIYEDEQSARIAAEVFIEMYIKGNLLRGNQFLSYEDAVKRYKEECEPFVIAHYGSDDVIALREAWNNWTDMLCKGGEIDDTQYHGWDNPY